MPENDQIPGEISSLEQGQKPWTQPVLESMDGGPGQVRFGGNDVTDGTASPQDAS